MTRTISLIIGIAVTALVVAVPTALGEGMLAGSQKQDGVAYFYANERATLAQQTSAPLVSRPDSHETIQPFAYIDAADRAARVRTVPSSDVVLLSGDDHTTFAPVDSATPVASSGRDLDWPQVGIGFGVGIALAFGLILALRATRQRPLAH